MPALEIVGTPRPLPASRWFSVYTRTLLAGDIVAILVADVLGAFLRFGDVTARPANVPYTIIAVVIVGVWLVALHAAGAYDVRHLGLGVEEIKRVIRGAAVAVGLVAVVCYLTRTDVARGYVGIVMPLALVFTLIGRAIVRRQVQSRRRSGQWTQRILAVGSPESVLALIMATRRSRSAGLVVVGACVDDMAIGSHLAGDVRVVGAVSSATRAAEAVHADVVALGATGLGSERIRSLGWELEGSGRALAMAPGLTEVAGPRVYVSPVEGLPLMWVEEPQFTGLSRLVKRAIDVTCAASLLVALSPLLLAAAVAVRATSSGPVLFRQSRLGANGVPFMVVKFRSMYAGAELRRHLLMDHNENDGALFKIKADPRITPVGRILRRLSIDELPQLWNVLVGSMSLVGPRPLATSDSTYTGHARRRLLVKPGMTGLWQVSGRSDLSWDDAVRLDLYYVENWSLAFDVSIIARTLQAVVQSKGAY